MKKYCKHRNCWILAGGNYLWCPDCGAIRRTEQSEKINGIYPVWSKWLYPEGQDIVLKKWEKYIINGRTKE